MGKAQDKAFVRTLSDEYITDILKDYYECDISRQMVLALISNGNIKNITIDPNDDNKVSYEMTNEIEEKE